MSTKSYYLLTTLLSFVLFTNCYSQETYAEKLGFPKDAKVLIIHVDDIGMSRESNLGAIDAMNNGVASSVSIMMPCPWVPDFVHYMKENPKVDAGLHLTLTSEWKDYRWHPLSGYTEVPGLIDEEGAFHHYAHQVVQNSNAEEVGKEIRSQIARARRMGFEPTHLDSHMGTLFADPTFLEQYVKIGIEEQIPIMFPGGHATVIGKKTKRDEATMMKFREIGKTLWDAGLPVLDDLHAQSYDWKIGIENPTDEQLRDFTTQKYIETLEEFEPGLTVVLMHCTVITDHYHHISGDANIRKGDLLAMTDPVFKKYLDDNGYIITTYREVLERRKALDK